ncbi:MAG: hypothetical protein KatS3mg111_2483 [Pirellulaceae bacterium]|nr:MAG: hypothetical protein KatS3mg111_2483 [Pirellulaceae bacterium]
MSGTNAISSDREHVDTATERRARRRWLSIIVGLLALQIAIGVGSIVLAVRDPTVAVTPNYYERAVNWDVTRRARLRTLQLGWKIDYVVLAPEKHASQRELRVFVRTADDQPVAELQLFGQAFHHARGNEIHQLQFDEIEAGVYQADVPIVQGGLWQIELRMEGSAGVAADARTLTVQ